MSKIISIEPAIDPNARPTFLLDWELTLKCNLDCSYCPSTGGNIAHDNARPHPPLEKCFESIDFMFAYVDLYMQKKPRWTRMVVLNVYGGESLLHPDIEIILREIRQRHAQYQDRWPLTVTCTTNAVIGKRRMENIVNYIDEFTVSYHCETLSKQKQQILENLSLIKSSNKRLKCIVLMHGDENKWTELLEVIEFCKSNDIAYLPKQLDGDVNSNYKQSQISWFKNTWDKRTPVRSQDTQKSVMINSDLDQEETQLSNVGRACCGGRLMCVNGELDQRIFYIPNNNFQGWACSVNWFFLFIRQDTGEIFSNKDCKMNFEGTVGPLGLLSDSKKLLADTQQRLELGVPHMTCAKTRCYCGLCAPKAETPDQLLATMKKHIVQ
jgi:pyruvate-formate lyase-activating enzyme